MIPFKNKHMSYQRRVIKPMDYLTINSYCKTQDLLFWSGIVYPVLLDR